MTKDGHMFSGSIPAMVTPFDGDAIDTDAIIRLVNWHINEGSSALVICGTTGEASTLDYRERIEVLRTAVEAAGGRIPIIAGAGSNNTAEAIRLTQGAEDIGVSATLHATGYYIKPSQEQVVKYYDDIAKIANKPVLIYNIPARTGVEISSESIARLSKHEKIIGIKDSIGDVSKVTEQRLLFDNQFCFLSGDDFTALGYIAHGGVGCISVTANVAPKYCSMLVASALSGDFVAARQLNNKLMPLHKALFIEPNPAGAKYALSRLGFCKPHLRAPLTELSNTTKKLIDRAMDEITDHRRGIGLAPPRG